MLLEDIRHLAGEIFDTVIQDRRHFHKFPELSFQEYETSAFVKSRLDAIGISWQPIANTGIVAIIKGDLPSDQVIALRADMDALRITETNDVDYISTKPGIMHACGHDVHTSSLLGTASILQQLKSNFGGTIKLLFQPGEEELPGGASVMIREGALEHPKPSAVIGQHVMPTLASGKIGFRKGKFMASKDDIYITVYGKGGHGAQPHENIDPVVIAAQVIVGLQQLVSRMAPPGIPTVLSFGKLLADGTTNIIPENVYMEGTLRTVDEEWRKKSHDKIRRIATGIAESMGGRCEVGIVPGYPFLINEEKLTSDLWCYAEDYVGKDNVVDLDIWMASEDFAYYSQVTDACFYMLGAGSQLKAINSSLHTPTFNIDEDAMKLSTGLMAYFALKRLGN
jgi:amidohydrolase